MIVKVLLAHNNYGIMTLDEPKKVIIDNKEYDTYPINNFSIPNYIDIDSKESTFWFKAQKIKNPKICILDIKPWSKICTSVQAITYALLNDNNEIVYTNTFPDYSIFIV